MVVVHVRTTAVAGVANIQGVAGSLYRKNISVRAPIAKCSRLTIMLIFAVVFFLQFAQTAFWANRHFAVSGPTSLDRKSVV